MARERHSVMEAGILLELQRVYGKREAQCNGSRHITGAVKGLELPVDYN